MKLKFHKDCDPIVLHDGRGLKTYGREAIAALVRFVRPPGIGGFEIEFAPSFGSDDWWQGTDGKIYRPARARHWSGRAWIGDNRILIRVPVKFLGRYKRPAKFVGEPGSAGYQGVRTFSAEESLVAILAHELRHLWQKEVPRGHRVWGARGRYSERDCDAFALAALRRWRRRDCSTGNNCMGGTT